MSVEYKENEQGVYWVDGTQHGEPQINLHHAMRDYELTVAGLKETDESARTADDSATAAGHIATNDGSAGEEADRGAGPEGAGGPEVGLGGEDAEDPELGGDGPEGEGDSEE